MLKKISYVIRNCQNIKENIENFDIFSIKIFVV